MVLLDPDLHQKLKSQAPKQAGRTMSAVVDELVRGWLAKEEAKERKARVA
jgi:hypothetical protein